MTQLLDGTVDPMRDEFLLLESVKVDNKLYCLNNRRLKCLWDYQQLVQHEVKVRLKVTKFKNPILQKFLRSYTSSHRGAEAPPAAL